MSSYKEYIDNPEYEVEKNPQGDVIAVRQKPQDYVKISRPGAADVQSKYIAHEFVKEDGTWKEVRREVRVSAEMGGGRTEYKPYVSEELEYRGGEISGGMQYGGSMGDYQQGAIVGEGGKVVHRFRPGKPVTSESRWYDPKTQKIYTGHKRPGAIRITKEQAANISKQQPSYEFKTVDGERKKVIRINPDFERDLNIHIRRKAEESATEVWGKQSFGVGGWSKVKERYDEKIEMGKDYSYESAAKEIEFNVAQQEAKIEQSKEFYDVIRKQEEAKRKKLYEEWEEKPISDKLRTIWSWGKEGTESPYSFGTAFHPVKESIINVKTDLKERYDKNKESYVPTFTDTKTGEPLTWKDVGHKVKTRYSQAGLFLRTGKFVSDKPDVEDKKIMFFKGTEGEGITGKVVGKGFEKWREGVIDTGTGFILKRIEKEDRYFPEIKVGYGERTTIISPAKSPSELYEDTKAVGEFTKGVSTGITTAIREKPHKIALQLGAAYLATGGAAPLVKGLSAKTFAKFSSFVFHPVMRKPVVYGGKIVTTTVKVGLPAAFAFSAGRKISMQPTAYLKGRVFGETTSELGAFVVGGYAGMRFGIRPLQRWSSVEVAKAQPEVLKHSPVYEWSKRWGEAIKIEHKFQPPKTDYGTLDFTKFKGVTSRMAKQLEHLFVHRGRVVAGSFGSSPWMEKYMGTWKEPGSFKSFFYRGKQYLSSKTPRIFKDIDPWIRLRNPERFGLKIEKVTRGRLVADPHEYITQRLAFSQTGFGKRLVKIHGDITKKMIRIRFPGEDIASKYFGALTPRKSDISGVTEFYRFNKDFVDLLAKTKVISEAGVTRYLGRPILPHEAAYLKSTIKWSETKFPELVRTADKDVWKWWNIKHEGGLPKDLDLGKLWSGSPSTKSFMLSSFTSEPPSLKITVKSIGSYAPSTKISLLGSLSPSSPSFSGFLPSSTSVYSSEYPSMSKSPSLSRSVSPSISKSLSKSVSPSFYSSPSPSLYSSPSPSPSPYGSLYKSPYLTDTPPPTPFGFNFPKGRGKPKFHVFVRRRKKWHKVSNIPLTRTKAFRLGKRKVGTTAAASFQVRPTEPGVSDPIFSTFLPGKFYTKKEDTGFTFIERPRFRISTPGEVAEIPYAGLKAQRRKKRLKLKPMRMI